MKDLWTVAKFTIQEMIKRKTFIISNIIILLIIVLGFNIPRVLDSIKGDNEQLDGNNIILVIDPDDIYKGNLEKLNKMNLGKNFKVQNNGLTIDEIKEKIDKSEIYAAMVIANQNNEIHIEYVKDSINTSSQEPKQIIEALGELYVNVKIGQLGLSDEQLASLNPNFDIKFTQTNENPASGNVFAIMLLSIVLFLCISSIKFNYNRKNI